MSLRAVIVNCTLKPTPGESNTEALAGLVAQALQVPDVEVEMHRALDFDIRPGVSSDEGEGDEWPRLRERIAAAIFVLATPTWLGQPSSVAKRVLERMDAMISENPSGWPAAGVRPGRGHRGDGERGWSALRHRRGGAGAAGHRRHGPGSGMDLLEHGTGAGADVPRESRPARVVARNRENGGREPDRGRARPQGPSHAHAVRPIGPSSSRTPLSAPRPGPGPQPARSDLSDVSSKSSIPVSSSTRRTLGCAETKVTRHPAALASRLAS